MDAEQRFEAQITEYKEVCENIRNSWTYITTLFRQYLAIQLFLLSVVGLGISFSSSALPGLTPQSASTTTAQQTQSRDADILKVARYVTLALFMGIGIALSFGAKEQSKRLFDNAARFVDRAAAIESHFGLEEFSTNETSDAPKVKTMPVHIYMRSRLHDTHLTKMQNWLDWSYLIGGFFWIGIPLIYFTAAIVYYR